MKREKCFSFSHVAEYKAKLSSAIILERNMNHYQNVCSFLPSQAVDLSLKFVPERSVDVVALVSDRLANMGRYVQVRSL